MYNNYDPKRVAEVLFTKAQKIHPAFAYGRRKDEEEDEFTLAFFLSCSDEQLEFLNSLVEDDEEVLVNFFVERGERNYPSVPTEAEKRNWDFSRPWKAQRMCCSWDELRDVPQPMLEIVFE